MKRKDMSFHFWENYFRTKKLENGHSSALTLTPGPSSDLRANMWDGRHQGNSMKLWGACQSRIAKTWTAFVRLLYHHLSMQWTLWTSPGPGLASTINVRKRHHIWIFQCKLTKVYWSLSHLIPVWYVLIRKVPVEEDMDGWEVEVSI